MAQFLVIARFDYYEIQAVITAKNATAAANKHRRIFPCRTIISVQPM